MCAGHSSGAGGILKSSILIPDKLSLFNNSTVNCVDRDQFKHNLPLYVIGEIFMTLAGAPLHTLAIALIAVHGGTHSLLLNIGARPGLTMYQVYTLCRRLLGRRPVGYIGGIAEHTTATRRARTVDCVRRRWRRSGGVHVCTADCQYARHVHDGRCS